MGERARGIPDRRSGTGSDRLSGKGRRKLKKLEEAEGSQSKTKSTSAEKVELDDIILSATERGLTMDDLRHMTLGQVVDFCIAYNKRQDRANKAQKYTEKHGTRRKATQSDINSFFG